jgi:hypothetical protein
VESDAEQPTVIRSIDERRDVEKRCRGRTRLGVADENSTGAFHDEDAPVARVADVEGALERDDMLKADRR